MERIKQLQKALNDLGISTHLIENAEWYCYDNKVHYGIELLTNIDTGEDNLSFHFLPNGRYIEDCKQAPIKNKNIKNTKKR